MKRFNYVVTLFVLLLSFTATAAEQIYFVQTDHLGAPEMLTDENQTIVWQASQDPFANSAPVTEQVKFDFRFPGQYYDAESGLFYNWNRYYDAGTGRYVTSDPIGLDGGLNTFGYVYQNPLVYYDPDGKRGKFLFKKIFDGCRWIWKKFKKPKKDKKNDPEPKVDPVREAKCKDAFLCCLNDRSVDEKLCFAAESTCRKTKGPMVFPGKGCSALTR